MTKKWYRIVWKHKDSSAQGQGEGTFLEEIADAWVEYGNKEYPLIRHWKEEVPS